MVVKYQQNNHTLKSDGYDITINNQQPVEGNFTITSDSIGAANKVHKHVVSDIEGLEYIDSNNIQFSRPFSIDYLHFKLEFFSNSSMTYLITDIYSNRDDDRDLILIYDNNRFIQYPAQGSSQLQEGNTVLVNLESMTFTGITYVRLTWFTSDDKIASMSVFTYPAVTPSIKETTTIKWK